MKTKILTFLSIFLACNSTFGADEFDDVVPVDLVKIFLNVPLGGDVSIYSDIPDNFPIFELPNDFSIIGSVDQGYMRRVALETSMSPEDAGTAIFEALINEGWADMTVQVTPQQQTGFIVNSPPVVGLGLTLCHDNLGNMQVQAISGENRTTVSLSQSGFANRGALIMRNNMSCEQQLAMRQGGPFGRPGMNNGVSQYMPRLELPEVDLPGYSIYPSMFSNGGGSFNDWEVRGNLAIDWPIDELADFFINQLEEQEWRNDSSWASGRVAGSAWSLSPEPDLELIGLLSILEIDEGNFELKFRIIGNNNQGGNSVFSGRITDGVFSN